jgi:maleate cis-trans isomerase
MVIHNDGVPETELKLMAPPGVAVFTARFQSPRRKGHAYEDDLVRAFVESSDLRRAAEMLGSMPLNYLVVAYASGAVLAGMEWDATVTTRVSEWAGGVPCVGSATAIVAAAAAFCVTRPLVVLPPWFGDELVKASGGFAASSGWPGATIYRADAGSEWRGLAPHEIYDRDGSWRVDPAAVGEHVAAAFPADGDSVIVLGSGLRSVELIEPLERRLDVPVVTPQQALLWWCLRTLGLPDSCPGFGRLFGQSLHVGHPQEVS